MSATEIAQREGVCRQWVSRVTKPFGPFPRAGAIAEATVEEWVAALQAGKSAERVARDHGVHPARVRQATRPYGPFTLQLTIDGWLTLSGVAEKLRVPTPTIRHWLASGSAAFAAQGSQGDTMTRRQLVWHRRTYQVACA